jgi:hypothetical protein
MHVESMCSLSCTWIVIIYLNLTPHLKPCPARPNFNDQVSYSPLQVYFNLPCTWNLAHAYPLLNDQVFYSPLQVYNDLSSPSSQYIPASPSTVDSDTSPSPANAPKFPYTYNKNYTQVKLQMSSAASAKIWICYTCEKYSLCESEPCCHFPYCCHFCLLDKGPLLETQQLACFLTTWPPIPKP